jgi:hypothetical protein
MHKTVSVSRLRMQEDKYQNLYDFDWVGYFAIYNGDGSMRLLKK